MTATSRAWTITDVASVGNLLLAAAKARRHKTRHPEVEAWWLRRESEIAALRDEMLSGAYVPGPYRFFEVHEPKRREIAAAPFRDRVVHHALCNLLAPVLERQFIARSFSSGAKRTHSPTGVPAPRDSGKRRGAPARLVAMGRTSGRGSCGFLKWREHRAVFIH